MHTFFTKILTKIDSISVSKHIGKHTIVAAAICLINLILLSFSNNNILTTALRYFFFFLLIFFCIIIAVIFYARHWSKRTAEAKARASLYAARTKIFRDDAKSISYETFVSYAQKSIRLEKKYAKRKSNNKRKRIVLCFHLTPCISSMESIYNAMMQRSDIDPYIVLVPTAQPGMDAKMDYSPGLIEYFDTHNYNYKLAYSNGNWFNLLELDPDGVFFQTPYALQLPALYDPDLSIAFPKTMYTPYGPWVMDRSVTAYIDSGIKKPFFNRLAYFFADKLSLEMLEFASPEYLSKSVLSGSPKVDFHRAENFPDTYCWKKTSDDMKKVMWLPRWGFADNRTSFMDYYEYFLEQIAKNTISFVIRPHPLMFKDLYKCGLFTMTGIEELKSKFELPPNSAIDNDFDYREGLLSCDFLVADFTSILYEYLPTGKPIIYTPKDNTLVDPRIIEACYVVRNKDEMRTVFEMLLNDVDPKKEDRLAIVESLEYFPHTEINNGSFIAKYVAENL